MSVVILWWTAPPLLKTSGWFCGVAMCRLSLSADRALQDWQAIVAVLQKSLCTSAILALQNGRTGPLYSMSVISKSRQKVSLEGAVSTPLAVEVGR
jgi:hypothetical protein